MNKKEFLYELRKELERLPFEERESAIQYYEEYFEEAGPELEEQTANTLGAPKEVAAGILADFVVKDNQKPAKNAKQGFSKVWLTIITIFASPIAVPVAVALAAVALVLAIAAFLVMRCVFLAGFSLLLTGLLCAVCSIFVLAQSPATTLFFFGVGLVAVGIGILISRFGIWLGRKSINGVARVFGKVLKKKKTAPKEGVVGNE